MSNEDNRFSARAARYVRVGSQVGTIAAKVAGSRLFGYELDRGRSAAELAAALGGLKGPLMKVAQLLSTIPEALPAEYATELAQLQSQAPPMGPAFVKRRMIAELGPEWQTRFKSFEPQAAASAPAVARFGQALLHARDAVKGIRDAGGRDSSVLHGGQNDSADAQAEIRHRLAKIGEDQEIDAGGNGADDPLLETVALHHGAHFHVVADDHPVEPGVLADRRDRLA